MPPLKNKDVPVIVVDGVVKLPPEANGACLPILDSDGIAAATVAADSACIGDGESTLTQGIISSVNETAYRFGARVGDTSLNVARTVGRKA